MKIHGNLFVTIALVISVVCLLSTPGMPVEPSAGNLGVEIGNLAPEFTLRDEAGNLVSLSDFRGKKVFLFSWATWCRCKEQLPALEQFYRKHKSDTFEVIAVASDSQGFKWVKPYLENADATFIALVDPNNELAAKYNFLATENGFLIDESGVVRLNEIGYDIRNDEQREKLEMLMAQDFGKTMPAEKKSLEEQISALKDGLEKYPKAFPKRLELAELYRITGDYDNAETELRAALEQKKKSAEAHYRLGVVLYHKGQIEEAVSEWEKAYKYESTNYLYMRNVEAYHDPENFYSDLENE